MESIRSNIISTYITACIDSFQRCSVFSFEQSVLHENLFRRTMYVLNKESQERTLIFEIRRHVYMLQHMKISTEHNDKAPHAQEVTSAKQDW